MLSIKNSNPLSIQVNQEHKDMQQSSLVGRFSGREVHNLAFISHRHVILKVMS